MVGGAWGGVVVRWGLGYAFHGYCFGYCIYVLGVEPWMVARGNDLKENFPGTILDKDYWKD